MPGRLRVVAHTAVGAPAACNISPARDVYKNEPDGVSDPQRQGVRCTCPRKKKNALRMLTRRAFFAFQLAAGSCSAAAATQRS